jgi:hypothetical protein
MEAPATAMRAATSTTVAAAPMLGESWCSHTNQADGSDSCKKSVQQGGFPHIDTLHLTTVSCPGGQTAFTNLILLGLFLWQESCPGFGALKKPRQSLTQIVRRNVPACFPSE